MTEKKKKILRAVIPIALIALIISGALALMTAQRMKTNVFRSGYVDLELWENFDTDGDGTPETYDASDTVPPSFEDLSPGDTVDKEPYIKNTGSMRQTDFMTVKVSKSTQITSMLSQFFMNGLMYDGDLFNLENIDTNSWNLIGNNEDANYSYYLFEYDDTVDKGEQTSPLFDSVTAVDDYDPLKIKIPLQRIQQYGAECTVSNDPQDGKYYRITPASISGFDMDTFEIFLTGLRFKFTSAFEQADSDFLEYPYRFEDNTDYYYNMIGHALWYDEDLYNSYFETPEYLAYKAKHPDRTQISEWGIFSKDDIEPAVADTFQESEDIGFVSVANKYGEQQILALACWRNQNLLNPGLYIFPECINSSSKAIITKNNLESITFNLSEELAEDVIRMGAEDYVGATVVVNAYGVEPSQLDGRNHLTAFNQIFDQSYAAPQEGDKYYD